MPDYQKMYHTMVWAAEQCIQLLADAERACEEPACRWTHTALPRWATERKLGSMIGRGSAV